MVLTGGCGSKSLVRAGGGSLKSLVVLVVLGIVAYISLRGLLAVFRVGLIEPVGTRLATPQDLPSLLVGVGVSKSILQVGLALLISVLFVVWCFVTAAFARSTIFLRVSVSARSSSLLGRSRARSGMWMSTRTLCRKRSYEPTRAGWSLYTAWPPGK